MEYAFSNQHLVDLFTKGSSKKYKFVDRVLARKFVERVNRIESANTIYDLREPPSMEFEKLKGYEKRFSIRIDKKHRLEFEIEFDNEEKTSGKVLVVDVTKHYE